ncbi:MAG: hypothetical protein QW767_01735 [Thermoprotei archaeon]
MIREVAVTAHSRLHISLFDMNGSLGRMNGGAGVVLNEPVLRLRVRGTQASSVERGLEPFVSRFTKVFGPVTASLELESMFPRHVGLGSTTQLALSVGAALSRLKGIRLSVDRLAAAMRRGGASGIGVYGFAGVGSFIVDAGHRVKGQEVFAPSDFSSKPPPPLIFARDLPASWRFVVCVPKKGKTVYGVSEKRFFEQNCPVPARETEALSRVVLSLLIPSVVEGDLEAFGDALNRIQGLGFKKRELQNQTEDVRRLISAGLKAGAAGGGLSSFGPTVFFACGSEKQAKRVVDDVLDDCLHVYSASPYGKGASIEEANRTIPSGK